MARHLLIFFVLGGLLLAGKTALEHRVATPLTTLQVVVKDSTNPEQLERAIDEAVLVEQAIEHGGALVDPVVREQLLSNMRDRSRAGERADVPADDATLLQRALALGLHRADPVTRQRLIFQAEQLLTASTASADVNESELARYLEEHAERYSLPARFSFTQLTLARARHGDNLEHDALALLARLREEHTAPGEARGDASLLPRDFDSASTVALDRQLGADFARQLESLPDGVWSGPVRSAYGLHVLFIAQRLPAALPTLTEVHERVLADYRHDHRRELLRERLRTLRASYRVQVRRLHG